MKILSGKCPNCGSNIDVTKNNGKCDYCGINYFIDDEIIHIEHSGSVNLKDNNRWEVAVVHLNNFKDYGKSEMLFKALLDDYAHKSEIYIFLIRSISQDFSLNSYNSKQVNEINLYWEKYLTFNPSNEEKNKIYNKIIKINSLYWKSEIDRLTNNFNDTEFSQNTLLVLNDSFETFLKFETDDEILDHYRRKIYHINANFWKNKILLYTSNFSYFGKIDLDEIKKFYDEFCKYCSNDSKFKNSYNEYVSNYDRKYTLYNLKIILLLGFIAICMFIFILALIFSKPIIRVNTIPSSRVKQCLSNSCSVDYFNDKYAKVFFKNHKNVEIYDYYFDLKDNVLFLKIKYNFIINKYYEYAIYIEDDLAPMITVHDQCEFSTSDTKRLRSCLSVFDLKDGYLNANVTLDLSNKDLNYPGLYSVPFFVTDSDGNTSSGTLKVYIYPSN